jgi:hypothetical protein
VRGQSRDGVHAGGSDRGVRVTKAGRDEGTTPGALGVASAAPNWPLGVASG